MAQEMYMSAVEITEDEYYISIKDSFDKKAKIKKPIRIIIAIVLSCLCLFWRYTVGLGIAILLVLAVAFIIPKIFNKPSLIRKYAKDSYAFNISIHEKMRYGFDENGFIIDGKCINAKIAWQLTYAYVENQEWLKVTVPGIMLLYYSVPDLKEQRMYNYLKDKLQENVVKK